MSSWRRVAYGSIVGLGTLSVELGVAELVAAVTGPRSEPVIALGQLIIEYVPESLKEFAIQHFGEHDKSVLVGAIVGFLVIAAVVLGVSLQRRRAVVLAGGSLALGGVAALAAVSLPGATWTSAVPSLAGACAALLGLGVVERGRLARDESSQVRPFGDEVPRREVLGRGLGLLAVGVSALALGRSLLSEAVSVAAARARILLPRPRSTDPVVPSAQLDVPGIAPYITPNRSFYRVDTALTIPQIDPSTYTLRVHGLVRRPFVVRFDELLSMPLIERTITLVCVSNPVGGHYIGNARWLGVPLALLLDRAGVDPRADQLLMTGADGMTIGADLRWARSQPASMLAVGMNGQPLPLEHGFPVRAVIPGIYGYASACKWLVDIDVTTFAAKEAYWVQRGYVREGRINLESRIDTPAPFATLAPGPVVVAGEAWLPAEGIAGVEVRVDGGPWSMASLGGVESIDSWRQWRWTWQATPGTHLIEVRAIAEDGELQTSRVRGVFPAGATGWDSVVVTVQAP